jgi:SAM-dependent methyltransferase
MTTFDEYERRAWAGQAEAYAQSRALLCGHTAPELLDAAQVGEGTRVLDVGTGPGTIAAAAAERGAEVTAVDAEPSMVERARRAAPEADIRLATLPELPFSPDEFEAVVGNFVLNHVGHPRSTLAELRRITRPGGRIALTVWTGEPAPGQALLGKALEAAGVARPATVPMLDTEEDFPRTEAGLPAVLRAAELLDVRCETLGWDHVVDPEVWWSGAAAGIAAVGQTVVAQPPDVIAEIRRHFDRLAEQFRTPEGTLALPHTALLVTATVS